MSFKRTFLAATILILSSVQLAQAQLPPDAVKLDRLKISEAQKPGDLCPVHLVASDPALPAWTHEGVEYRGHEASCQAAFEADPAAYIGAAHEKRYVNNFMADMSRIWCPVTDEISPGGLTEWERDGLVWESCCDFCDGSYVEEDFVDARERLEARAHKAYAMTGGKYTEGSDSPVAGAIDFGDGLPPLEDEPAAAHDHASHDHGAKTVEVASIPEPDYLAGKKLEATYAGGIGQLFDARCVTCHKTGGFAPMSFESQGKIRKWAKSLEESVNTRGMPPWPAAQGGFHYSNSRHLTDSELALVNDWIAAGYPAGEGSFKSTVAAGGEWSIGEPDHVFEVPGYKLGTDETGKVIEVQVVTDFPEDRWIVAAEAKPGDEWTIFGIDAGPLGSYYPGGEPDVHAAGSARLLTAGETVTVRLTNVKEKGYELPVGASRLAVKFAEAPGDIAQTIQMEPLAAGHFMIAAGAEDAEVTASYVFGYDAKVHAFRPVMNARGKSAKITAVAPDGSETLLLDIPRWNPDYKLRYALAEPFSVVSGTKIVLTGIYDNSKLNARNPDASVEVHSGPGGEVLEGRLEYSLD